MANFFKDYQAAVRAAKEAQEPPKPEHRYERGQIVRIPYFLDENGNGKRYFVDYLSGDCVLLSKNKKEAMAGYGHIYSIHDIVG